MRSLLAAGLLLAAFALPVSAKPADPYLTLDTPGPYHYGDVIVVSTHEVPHYETNVHMQCFQDGTPVWAEVFESAQERSYEFHLGSNDSSWDGGLADCAIRFVKSSHIIREPFTVINIHVEA